MDLNESRFPARDRWNSRVVRESRYTGPSSYATGGDPTKASADLGMSEVFGVYGTISDGSEVRIPWLDYPNQKIRWFIPDSDAEVASGVNLSTFSGTLLFTGKG